MNKRQADKIQRQRMDFGRKFRGGTLAKADKASRLMYSEVFAPIAIGEQQIFVGFKALQPKPGK